ncbi:hypothetical protein ElyMa_002304200 [Elysia marginata]|uniref:Uncharacterized protein n=1 Tax=Elysia marginata TaxID=1093978 RepID=A0AAV4G3B3_9GAST|nr:hypothetical protein ElyMa_002304200 [Elysia marginata]
MYCLDVALRPNLLRLSLGRKKQCWMNSIEGRVTSVEPDGQTEFDGSGWIRFVRLSFVVRSTPPGKKKGAGAEGGTEGHV